MESDLAAHYAALTASAPEPDPRTALGTAGGFLRDDPLASPPPLQLHAAREVAEALAARCPRDTSIFGVIVNRTTVTLPTFHGPATASDLAAIRWALVGLTESEATAVAQRSGWTIRVVERDGVPLTVIRDRENDRIDVVVRDRIVMSTSVG